MFPSEADTAVDLHTELCVPLRRRQRQRRSHGRAIGELVPAVIGGSCCIPHECGRQLRRHQHVCAMVLDRLERGNRTPKLDSDLGVLAGLLGALSRNSNGLGADDQPGEILEESELLREARGPLPLRRSRVHSAWLDPDLLGTRPPRRTQIDRRGSHHRRQEWRTSGPNHRPRLPLRSHVPSPLEHQRPCRGRTPQTSFLLARPGKYRSLISSGATAATRALTTTVGMKGPGANARPNCSTTTTSSDMP